MNARAPRLFHLAAICFAALIAFQSTGWLMAWQGLHFRAKEQAAQQMLQAETPLQEAVFQKDYFQTLRVGRKEIRLAGQLYDYRLLAETADSVRVSLYHDAHEQALLAALGQAIRPDSKASEHQAPPMMLWLAKWLGSSFIVPAKLVLSAPKPDTQPKLAFFTLLFQAQSRPSVLAPPPEC